MALGDEVKELRDELRTLRNEVNDLRRFQAYIMGAVATAGAIVGLFIQNIKAKLGIG